MNAGEALATAAGVTSGMLAATVASRVALRSPPASLLRVNVRGLNVPAVLGGPLLAGTIVGVLVVSLFERFGATEFRPGVVIAVVTTTAIMFVAGSFDDRRGDERPRGFSGHLGALRQGAVTGGVVKLLAGTVAGVLAGILVADRVSVIVEVGLLVALSANLLNLLDRAPGRAGKLGLAAAIVLLAASTPTWGMAASGLIGALLVVLALDLREHGMLGDAGANPLGAVLGLGVAEALGEPSRVATIVLLLILNVASERWSFSRIIEASPPLRALDRLGRK